MNNRDRIMLTSPPRDPGPGLGCVSVSSEAFGTSDLQWGAYL
jgi:hypothetical protein